MTRHLLRDDDLTAGRAGRDPRSRRRAEEGPLEAASRSPARRRSRSSSTSPRRARASRSRSASPISAASPLIISTANSQLGGKETPSDTARVLERQVAAIVWRTYAQAGLEEMAAGTTVPVVNALSDDFHPCQLLADLLTIREHKGDARRPHARVLRRRPLATWRTRTCSRASPPACTCASPRPRRYAPREDVVADADRRRRARPAARSRSTPMPNEAAAGADVDRHRHLGVDGQGGGEARRACATSASTRSTRELMTLAKPDAIFIHCLPADRGYEVDAEVIDGPQSVVWDEAENRLHAQKALLVWLLRQG